MAKLAFNHTAPQKMCTDCGLCMDEVAECYFDVCDKCLRNQEE